MKRKHKLYSRPKRPFDKKRIEEEAKIKEEFGLKNKKEIWKTEAKVKLIRERAKRIIHTNQDEQKSFFNRLNKIGIKANSIADVLSLDKKDYLKRRLQTIVFRRKLANTIKHARQMIVHKNVLVDGRVINSPSYIVPIELENKINLKKKNKKINSEEIKK
ncbi:MAG: 30S ribosomal protein S4 [Candidatus Pacearchaeota archaeon]